MQATLYVVGRSDDNIINNLNPHPVKKEKKIGFLFPSPFCGRFLSSSYLPTLSQSTYSDVYGDMNFLLKESNKCFCLKCIKNCSVFTSPSIASKKKSYRQNKSVPRQDCLSAFSVFNCHLNCCVYVHTHTHKHTQNSFSFSCAFYSPWLL